MTKLEANKQIQAILNQVEWVNKVDAPFLDAIIDCDVDDLMNKIQKDIDENI